MMVTKVKYTLSRRLTWSEREALRDWLIVDRDLIEHKVSKDALSVTVTFKGFIDSRVVTELIRDFCETLLNVHPVSAHTLIPRVRV